MLVSDTMTKKVFRVREDDPLPAIYERMEALGIRHVPVTRKDKVVGIISDRDVLKHSLLDGHRLVVPDLTAGQVMTPDVVCCSPSTLVGTVAGKMVARKIDAVVVTKSRGVLAGIVTSTDIMGLLASKPSLYAQRTIPFKFEFFGITEPWGEAI